jgi:DNA-binding MarR family transcriptional regulator
MSKILTQIQETLQQFGFSNNETKILVALTKYGAMTILEISNTTDLARTSIYNYIQKLSRRGLVAMVIDDYTKKYEVIQPEELEENLIKRNQVSIQKTISTLKSIQNTSNQSNEITVTKGLDNLKKIYENILKSKNKSQYMIKGGDYETWLNMDKEFFGGFEVRRGIMFSSIRCLFNPTTKISKSPLQPTSNNANIKILPVGQTLLTNAILVDGTKIIHELQEPYKCIVFRNDFLFAMEKQEFEILWSLL